MAADIKETIKAADMVKIICKKYGKEALAYYLQGSAGPCPYCGCKTPPHTNDCEFVKAAKEVLKGAENNT